MPIDTPEELRQHIELAIKIELVSGALGQGMIRCLRGT